MASSSGDRKAYLTSNIDFYSLLDLSPGFSQKELDRAWRKTALKYHPDKVGASDTAAREAASEKFHHASIAYEIFSDQSSRQLYDNAREARERRRQQEELLQGKRRQMKQDLEARERAATSGSKPARDAVSEAEERWERELRRIAEDGMRRRAEREEMIRRQMIEDQEKSGQMKKEEEKQARQKATPQAQRDSNLEKRSVKVKFIRNPESEALDKQVLEEMFSTLGVVEDVILLEDKRQRLGNSREKATMGRALVVFKSIEEAYLAVEGWVDEKVSRGGLWTTFEDVFWAEGKEPEYLADTSTAPPLHTTSEPNAPSFKNTSSAQSFKIKAASVDGEVLLGAPGSGQTGEGAPQTANILEVEESTMIRLHRAEERRLAANKPAIYRLQANVMVT